jgi:large subunit ribosomal protein L35
MPKMKTNKSVAKRFKVTAGGKVKRMRANKSHILTKKASKRKRRLRQPDVAAPGDAKRVRRMLLKGG